MKKLVLTFLLLPALASVALAQIVISEIMYNPPEAGTDSLEYIELYNNSGAAVDVSNWAFTAGVTFTFPAGATIQAGQYVVIAKRDTSVLGIFPYEWNVNEALSNSGEHIELHDAAGNIVDAVDYKNAAPWPIEAAGGGASIVLCDPNSDNNNPASWQAATTATGLIINGKEIKANPGGPSACSGTNTLSATNDQVNVPTGQSKTIPVLANDLVPNPVTSLTVLGAPQHGTAVVNANNTITYTPNAGYCGADAFQYKVCDASLCDTANVAIKVICYPVYPISKVTTENANGAADSLNVYCELTGNVYGVNFRPVTGAFQTVLFTLIDDNGAGISVSSLTNNFGYTVKEKDKVTVRGRIGQFNGQTEINPDTIIKISANNPLLNPTVVVNHSEATESQLIKINNLHFVDATEWTTGMGASGFTVRALSNDHPTDTVFIRIDRDVETYNAPVPTEPFDLTGLGGQFDNTAPFTSGYQILPRYNADISTLPSAVHNVDFSAQVLLMPNPATDQLSIRMNIDFDRIVVLSAMGTLVKTIEQPGFAEKLPLGNLATGTYFVRFEKDGAVWTTRFVKI